MLHTPPEDEILELREIAHNFNERGKEENYLWLMALSDRLQGYRARVAALEAGLGQIAHLARHAPGAGQASTLQLIENFADKALAG